MRGTIITRETKTKGRPYVAVINVGGKQKWSTFAKKKSAEAYLDSLSPDVRDGTYRELRRARFDEYLSHFESTHMAHLKPTFGPYQLTAIGPAEINAFAAALAKREGVRKRRPLA